MTINACQDFIEIKISTKEADKMLVMLLDNPEVIKNFNLPQDIIPLLIAYNTSVHEITSQCLITKRFDEILQSQLNCIFLLVGQIPV